MRTSRFVGFLPSRRIRGNRQKRNRVDVEPYCGVNTYIAGAEGYKFFDSYRFKAINEAAADVHRFSNGSLTRLGAWVARWNHWGPNPNNLPTHGICDLAWARTEQELEYHNAMRTVMDDAWKGRTRCVRPLDYRGWRPAAIDNLDWLLNWENWVSDISMERRIRNRGRSDGDYFIGWHNLEFFSVPVAERPRSYQAVPDWWRRTVEVSPLYPVPTPYIYHYFTTYTMHAQAVANKSFESFAQVEYAYNAVATAIGVGRYGSYRSDLPDDRLGNRDRLLTHTAIAPLSEVVDELIDQWGDVNLVHNADRAAECLLLLRRIREIDWAATFRGKSQSRAGRFLRYDFDTGEVTGIAAFTDSVPQYANGRRVGFRRVVFDAVEPVWHNVSRASLASCQGEIDAKRASVQASTPEPTDNNLPASAILPEVVQVFRDFNRNVPEGTAGLVGVLRTFFEHAEGNDAQAMAALRTENAQLRGQVETITTQSAAEVARLNEVIATRDETIRNTESVAKRSAEESDNLRLTLAAAQRDLEGRTQELNAMRDELQRVQGVVDRTAADREAFATERGDFRRGRAVIANRARFAVGSVVCNHSVMIQRQLGNLVRQLNDSIPHIVMDNGDGGIEVNDDAFREWAALNPLESRAPLQPLSTDAPPIPDINRVLLSNPRRTDRSTPTRRDPNSSDPQ